MFLALTGEETRMSDVGFESDNRTRESSKSRLRLSRSLLGVIPALKERMILDMNGRTKFRLKRSSSAMLKGPHTYIYVDTMKATTWM